MDGSGSYDTEPGDVAMGKGSQNNDVLVENMDRGFVTPIKMTPPAGASTRRSLAEGFVGDTDTIGWVVLAT